MMRSSFGVGSTRRSLLPVFALVFAATFVSRRVRADVETLTLDEAIELALAQTPDIVQAKTDVLLVDVERARALSAIRPRVDLSLTVADTINGRPLIEQPDYPSAICNPSFGRPCPPNTIRSDDPLAQIEGVRPVRFDDFLDQQVVNTFDISNFTGVLAARQLVFDGGRWWHVIDRVESVGRLRRSVLGLIRNNVRMNVVRQFYGLERARQAVRTFLIQLEVSEGGLERARSLLEEGKGQAADVAAAERNLAQDRVTLARLEFGESRARRAFNLALARAPETPVHIAVPAEVSTATAAIGAVTLPPLSMLEALAQWARPDLAIRRATLGIQEHNIAIQRADYFPSVSVGGSYVRTTRSIDRFFADLRQNYFLRFDVTVRWNLYDGLRTGAAVDEAELILKKNQSEYEETERAVMGEVQDRRENLELQLRVYELARVGVSSATEAVRLARALYDEGKTNALQLRDAELRFTQALTGAINARLEVEIAREELRRAVGTDVPGL